MRTLLATLLLAASIARPETPKGATTAAPLRVSAAIALCRAHPTAHERLWVRGWFVPAIDGAGFAEGGLFDSRQAVPVTTVDQWDVNGNWRKYGALYVHITTEATFGPRSLTLHGRLVCSSFRFWTDRDPFPPPQLKTVYGTTHVGRTGPTTTWVTAGGLKLMLTVPRTVYPRNALARVMVSMQNVSRHTIGYWVSPSIGPTGVASPQAEVLDRSGRIVFPPAMPYMPAWPGPRPYVAPLHPGKSIRASEYIVVRGARIRASQPFAPDWSPSIQRAPSVQRAVSTLRTRPITVRLTYEPAPRLTLHATGQRLVVDVTRPAGVVGGPLRLSYADCGAATYEPNNVEYTEVWVVSGLHLTPACAPVRDWHLRVAWLNHPVAALDYTPPQPVPTSTPIPTAAPTRTPVPSPTPGPGFDDLLHRAAHAMAPVRTLHVTGRRTSVDSSARMRVAIQADCRSARDNGIPVRVRTLVMGRQSEAGRIDYGYILDGPVLSRPHTAMRAWYRSLATRGQWRVTDLNRWRQDQGLTDPVWTVDLAYLNQVCPDLIRLTYLTSPVPYAQHTVLGTQVLDGRQVFHLREHLYFTLDLFLDARSFELRRLVLGDQPGPGNYWEIRFDYSRFNAPIHIPVPGGAHT